MAHYSSKCRVEKCVFKTTTNEASFFDRRRVFKAQNAFKNCTAHMSTCMDWQDFCRKQAKLKRLPSAEAARTLVDNGRFGVLSAISAKEHLCDAPIGSYVNYVADMEGRPIFSVSTKADHTQDIERDGRISLFVVEGNKLDARDQMATVTGMALPVTSDAAAVREIYLEKSPGSFWVDFGDFRWFRMESILNVRFLPGVQTVARNINGQDYQCMMPDPVAKFSSDVEKTINSERAEELHRAVECFLSAAVDVAKLKRVDRYGVDVFFTAFGRKGIPCRIPFSTPALTKEEVFQRLDELLLPATDVASSNGLAP